MSAIFQGEQLVVALYVLGLNTIYSGRLKPVFLSYSLKCCQSIRLQYSLIVNIFGSNQSISQIFGMEIIIKER